MPQDLDVKADDRRRFVISLEGVEFAEGTDSAWIHLLPFAEVEHPVYGDIKLDAEKMDDFVKNFNAGVAGTQQMVNYEHRKGPEGGRAAAWFSSLERRDDGLWGKASWTPRAAQALRDGEYKYLSSEYYDTYKREAKGSKEFKNVFTGAALTNIPYFKGLSPVNFQDFDAFDPPDGQYAPDDLNYRMANSSTIRCLNCKFFQPSGDGDMGSCLVVSGEIDADWVCDCFAAMYANGMGYQEPEEVRMEEFLKQLAVALGMPEDAEDSKIFAAVIERIKSPAPSPVQAEDEKARKFAEDYPEQAAALKALEERNLTLEVKDLVKSWTVGAKYGVPPAVLEDLTTLRKQLSGNQASIFDDVLTKITQTGLVRMEVVGGTDPTKMGDASDQFLGLVRKYQEEHEKVSFANAVRAVSKLQPDLAKAYAEERPKLGGGTGGAVAGESFIDA